LLEKLREGKEISEDGRSWRETWGLKLELKRRDKWYQGRVVQLSLCLCVPMLLCAFIYFAE